MDERRFLGQRVVDREGRDLGRVAAVWRDAATGRADFVSVDGGPFGRECVVPLPGARREGDVIRIAHAADVVERAPRLSGARVSGEPEAALRRHYGLASADASARVRRAFLPESDLERLRARLDEAFRESDEETEDRLRLKQVLRFDRAGGEVGGEAVVEDDVVIPVRDDENAGVGRRLP